MYPVFLPYLFDNQVAWDRTIADPRWYYDMPFFEFMNLYQAYRNGIVPDYKPTEQMITKSPSESDMILSQEEIDDLINGIQR